jgi:methionyl aminopeptidase
MINIKSANDADAMRQGGKILARILLELKDATKPGVKRIEIDSLARRLCLKYHVKPSFLGYTGYPSAVCISTNEEVVHGLASDKEIAEGDLVSLDMGVEYAGFHTDSALSFICKQSGNTTDDKIIKTVEHAFYSGVDLIKNGVHLGDISAKIQVTAEHEGYGVIRMLVGHGIGREVHEDPHVPNWGTAGTGPILTTGMVIAIEPMITESGCVDVVLSDDKWTYSAKDGSRAAHFEHTVLVTDEGYEILTQP